MSMDADFKIANAMVVSRLSDLLDRLGVTCYGRMDEDLGEFLDHHGDASAEAVAQPPVPLSATADGSVSTTWLRETVSGVNVINPDTGDELAVFRSYWDAGSEDDVEHRPNLEVPSIGLKVWWYKYAWRGAYSNVPVDMDVVARIELALQPALKASSTSAPQPTVIPVAWKPVLAKPAGSADPCKPPVEWKATPAGADWTVGYVWLTGTGNARDDVYDERGLWSVELQSRIDSHSFFVGSFHSQVEAFKWAELRARSWTEPAWKAAASED